MKLSEWHYYASGGGEEKADLLKLKGLYFAKELLTYSFNFIVGQNHLYMSTRGEVLVNTRYFLEHLIFSVKGHIAINGNTVKCQEIVYFQAAARRMGLGLSIRSTPYVGVQLFSFQDRYPLSYLND